MVQLLDEGVPVDIEDGDGRTALHYAAMLNRTDVMHELLESGADVNKRDRDDGKTALHYSAWHNNNTDAIWLLLRNGASTTIKDKRGLIPINWAREENSQEAVLLLQQ